MEQCVICLNDEPNILCYDCMHICICLKCEELKPLAACPYCRASVLEKKLYLKNMKVNFKKRNWIFFFFNLNFFYVTK